MPPSSLRRLVLALFGALLVLGLASSTQASTAETRVRGLDATIAYCTQLAERSQPTNHRANYDEAVANAADSCGAAEGAVARSLSSAALGDVGGGSSLVNAQQAAHLARFQSKLPAAADATFVRALPKGGVAFQADVAGRVPGLFATYEKQVDVAGKTLQFTKTTINPAGEIVHAKDKITGFTFWGP